MKTLNITLKDSSYNLIKSTIANKDINFSDFIEFATLEYIKSLNYVSDEEMKIILEDKILVNNLKTGFNEIENEDYIII